MSFDIRFAQPKDAVAIAGIFNKIIRNTLITFSTEEKSAIEICKLLAKRGRVYLVAVVANKVVGFATYSQFRPGQGYRHTVEHSIHLSPHMQRHGIGRALMEHLESAARTRGAHILVAGISSGNLGAVEFHTPLGFVQVGCMPEIGQKWGQKLDLILMQKRIGMHNSQKS